MKSKDTGASKLISLWVFLNCELRSHLPVYEVWVENIEFIPLDHLQLDKDPQLVLYGSQITKTWQTHI